MKGTLTLLAPLFAVLSESISMLSQFFYNPHQLTNAPVDQNAALRSKIDRCTEHSGRATVFTRFLAEGLEELIKRVAGTDTPKDLRSDWMEVLAAFSAAKLLLDRSVMREIFLSGCAFPRQREMGPWDAFESIALARPPEEIEPDPRHPEDVRPKLLYRIELKPAWRVEFVDERMPEYGVFDPAGRCRATFTYRENPRLPPHASFRIIPRYEVVKNNGSNNVTGSAPHSPESRPVRYLVIDHATKGVIYEGDPAASGPPADQPISRASGTSAYDQVLTQEREKANQWLTIHCGAWVPYESDSCWDATGPPTIRPITPAPSPTA